MKNENAQPFRSPNLMSPSDSALVVIDVQEKLIPLIHRHEKIVWNIERLLEAAAVLGVKTRATEQYPKGLGGTVGGIVEKLDGASDSIPDKLMFSVRECNSVFQELFDSGICNLVLCGCLLYTSPSPRDRG